MRLALRATMALAALALALAAPAARRHELHAAPPAARRLEVDYEGYKKLAMEGNAEALQQKFKHASPEEQLAIKNEILRMRGEKPVELPERKQGGGGGGKRLARGSDGKMHDVADPVEAGKEFARRHGMDGALRAARHPPPVRAHTTHRPAAQTTSTRRRSATRPSRCGRASTT